MAGMILAGPSNVNVSLANGFGMTQRPMTMGANGVLGPSGGVGSGGPGGSGPQEWEWLTMSL
jgi:hypothetical protein